MGRLLDRIKDITNKWKKREEKIDQILDTTLLDLQELTKLVESLQDNSEDFKTILETMRERQLELGLKIEEIDKDYKKMKQSMWYRIFFGV